MKRIVLFVLLPIIVLSLSSCRSDTKSAEEMADLEEKIAYFKQPCPERSYNVLKFGTVDELITFINHANLDPTVFKLLYEENALFIPEAPQSWGTLKHCYIQSNGIIGLEYTRPIEPHPATPTPDAVNGITPPPQKEKARTEAFVCFDIRTKENSENQINTITRDCAKEYKLKNETDVYIDSSGNANMIYQGKYYLKLWGDIGSHNEVEQLTLRKLPLDLKK